MTADEQIAQFRENEARRLAAEKDKSFEAPSTNEVVAAGDPLDIIKNDSNSDDKSVDDTPANESKGPGNSREELNPVDDKPVTNTAQPDIPLDIAGYKRVIVPNDFLAQIAVILRDSGADTRSQTTALAKIEEMFDLATKHPHFNLAATDSVTEGNVNINDNIQGTKTQPKHGEIPASK